MPWNLAQAMMIALVARLSGLRAIVERCGQWLGTLNFSSLSHAISRGSFVQCLKRMVESLESSHTPEAGELVALDGMAVTLPKTQRHNCAKFNDKTVGGGVVWAYMIHAAKGVCPVKILKVVQGAWHDSKVMRTVALIRKGPVYLMDRGFACYVLIQQWLTDQVHFIVRLNKKELRYDVIREIQPARRWKSQCILVDAVAQLGIAQRKIRPIVRLVIAQLATGEWLILASDRMNWSAEQILAAYKQRWHIERFHRFLKDTLGLAHLYNFRQDGIEFLIYTALLAALLLFFSDATPSGDTIVLLRQILRAVRSALGLGIPWKRNTFSPRRAKAKPITQQEKNH